MPQRVSAVDQTPEAAADQDRLRAKTAATFGKATSFQAGGGPTLPDPRDEGINRILSTFSPGFGNGSVHAAGPPPSWTTLSDLLGHLFSGSIGGKPLNEDVTLTEHLPAGSRSGPTAYDDNVKLTGRRSAFPYRLPTNDFLHELSSGALEEPDGYPNAQSAVDKVRAIIGPLLDATKK